jgi:hypothetical protein
VDADGRAYRLVAIDGDGLGGDLVAQWAQSTGSAPSGVPTGVLRPIALDVARTEPTSVGGVAAQRVIFADSGAPLGDWTTQVVADDETLRLSDGQTILSSSRSMRPATRPFCGPWMASRPWLRPRR